ncbi:hypothetical protein CXB51_029454 [Gossypium anomalum]|uniref:Legume lectin domain-containing protein n=1 Tax=Gossypium anomalum TaxID=47600 RepID=A0A8J5YNW1_9ROSI|nr:hypothetical protein CXB51_029454 [Gossypium anomalum]
MGTTGGDRDRLYKTVEESRVYAVISPQMGKQVVAFLAAMEIMAEQFPGAFSGYSLQVMKSHQAGKLDTSGTAKAIISCFQKLGVSFDMDPIQMIRDPKQQIEMVGVPEEHLSGHAFHLYHLTSPDQTILFAADRYTRSELLMLYFSLLRRVGRVALRDHNVDYNKCHGETRVKSKADKRIYNMIDVLQEVFLVQVTCFYFNFLTFQKEDESQLILILGAIQVTPDVNGGSMENLSGRALQPHHHCFFQYEFVLNILNQTSRGGEGVAFLINDNSSLPDNCQGWWLGMVNANTNGSSQASVAVEFDTRKSDERDMEGNHFGLNINRIQSTNQVSLSNYDVNISAGGQDLRVHLFHWGQPDTCAFLACRSLYLSSAEDFHGILWFNSNETELNCVKSWAFSDTDIGGNGNQLCVWIIWFQWQVWLKELRITILQTVQRKLTRQHENDYDTKLSELKGALSSEVGNTEKLAIRFQEGRASEGDGPDPASSGHAEMEIVNLGLAADSSSHRSPIDNSLSVPVITKILKPVDFRLPYQPTLKMSDGKEVMVDNQYLKANNPLLIIMAKPARGPARRDQPAGMDEV